MEVASQDMFGDDGGEFSEDITDLPSVVPPPPKDKRKKKKAVSRKKLKTKKRGAKASTSAAGEEMDAEPTEGEEGSSASASSGISSGSSPDSSLISREFQPEGEPAAGSSTATASTFEKGSNDNDKENAAVGPKPTGETSPSKPSPRKGRQKEIVRPDLVVAVALSDSQEDDGLLVQEIKQFDRRTTRSRSKKPEDVALPPPPPAKSSRKRAGGGTLKAASAMPPPPKLRYLGRSETPPFFNDSSATIVGVEGGVGNESEETLVDDPEFEISMTLGNEVVAAEFLTSSTSPTPTPVENAEKDALAIQKKSKKAISPIPETAVEPTTAAATGSSLQISEVSVNVSTQLPGTSKNPPEQTSNAPLSPTPASVAPNITFPTPPSQRSYFAPDSVDPNAAPPVFNYDPSTVPISFNFSVLANFNSENDTSSSSPAIVFLKRSPEKVSPVKIEKSTQEKEAETKGKGKKKGILKDQKRKRESEEGNDNEEEDNDDGKNVKFAATQELEEVHRISPVDLDVEANHNIPQRSPRTRADRSTRQGQGASADEQRPKRVTPGRWGWHGQRTSALRRTALFPGKGRDGVTVVEESQSQQGPSKKKIKAQHHDHSDDVGTNVSASVDGKKVSPFPEILKAWKKRDVEAQLKVSNHSDEQGATAPRIENDGDGNENAFPLPLTRKGKAKGALVSSLSSTSTPMRTKVLPRPAFDVSVIPESEPRSSQASISGMGALSKARDIPTPAQTATTGSPLQIVDSEGNLVNLPPVNNTLDSSAYSPLQNWEEVGFEVSQLLSEEDLGAIGYPALSKCEDMISEALAKELCKIADVLRFKDHLVAQGIKTVGDLCKLNRHALTKLPLGKTSGFHRNQKISHFLHVMKKYEDGKITKAQVLSQNQMQNGDRGTAENDMALVPFPINGSSSGALSQQARNRNPPSRVFGGNANAEDRRSLEPFNPFSVPSKPAIRLYSENPATPNGASTSGQFDSTNNSMLGNMSLSFPSPSKLFTQLQNRRISLEGNAPMGMSNLGLGQGTSSSIPRGDLPSLSQLQNLASIVEKQNRQKLESLENLVTSTAEVVKSTCSPEEKNNLIKLFMEKVL